MRHIPKAYERYRHFKGNCYQILAIAKSSEDATEQVVYQALYPPFDIYVRPLSMFMSEVDHAKYPAAAQRYRFELVSGGEAEAAVLPDEVSVCRTEAAVQSGAVQAPADTDMDADTDAEVDTDVDADAVTAVDAVAAGDAVTAVDTDTDADVEADADADGKVDENVMAFLDADTYEQKLKIFSSIRDKVTQEMLNTIAVSLDIEVGAGDLEERYRQIQNCLMTFQRYECSRLR
ncbi:MAG: DUF1653 domain-containing protein [Clostridium sp.]|nr:DUF1653 domain-containing protein [Clostridium sp.]